MSLCFLVGGGGGNDENLVRIVDSIADNEFGSPGLGKNAADYAVDDGFGIHEQIHAPSDHGARDVDAQEIALA